MGLLAYARDDFSQNGEDGVIAEIFRRIGGRCCEFGAWDGVHFSNTRALILQGWSAVLIESDNRKFEELRETYADRNDVLCLNEKVSAPAPLAGILGSDPRLDFLSVDIDGRDYEIVESLDIEPPRVLCVEINTGHAPDEQRPVASDIAARNVGQPFARIAAAAEKHGYRLVANTGNAFFVHEDVGRSISSPRFPSHKHTPSILRASIGRHGSGSIS